MKFPTVILITLFAVFSGFTTTETYTSRNTQRTTQIFEERYNYDVVSSAFAFMRSQDLSLDLIAELHPQLSSDARLAKAKFNGAFENAKKVAEHEMRQHHGAAFDSFKKELDDMFVEYLAGHLVDPSFAIIQIQTVSNRAKGEIESPFLEEILALEYSREPHMEMRRGHKQVFSSKGHPKAQGIHVSMNLPKSFYREDAERPNMLVQFNSRLGGAHANIMVGIKHIDLPGGRAFRDSELDDFFSEKNVLQMAPPGMKALTARKITIDNRKAGELVYEGRSENAGVSVCIRVVHVMTMYKNKMIMLQGAVAASTMDGLVEPYNIMLPLFQSVALSFVIHNQW